MRLRRSVPFALAAVVFGTSAADVAAGKRHHIGRTAADVSLNTSPWSKVNDAGGTCTGVGAFRRDVGNRKLYATWRCPVKNSVGENRGVVITTTTGPESVRISRVESGDLSPDVPIGAIPRTRPRMRSLDITDSVLGKTAWARGKDLFGVLCSGVGGFRDTDSGFLFGTFVCRVRVLSEEQAVLLVQATSTRSVRVVRTLA